MPGIDTRGAGADRDEQRIGGVAELLAGDALDMGDAGGDFGLQALGEGLALVIIDARTSAVRDGEAGRDRQADRGHAVEIGALAAEQVLVALAAVATHPRRSGTHIASSTSLLTTWHRRLPQVPNKGKAADYVVRRQDLL